MYRMGSITWTKGRTHPGQFVCVYRVLSQFPQRAHLIYSSIRRTIENCAAGNIELAPEDLADIKHVIAINSVRGTRY